MVSLKFGAFTVQLWKAFDKVYHGECVMDKPPRHTNFPKIMTDGIPFIVTKNGIEGEYTKYIFPSLIPLILKECKF